MSNIWLDSKYLGMMSFRLRNFKKKSNHSWNFSCPYCGDSKTNKSKARGYVYPIKGKLRYHCHNCNIPGIDVGKLLKHEDLGLYAEYVKECLLEIGPRVKSDVEVFADKMKPPKFVKDTPLSQLKKVSQFKADSMVRLWINNRLIPARFHHKLYICKGFKQWVNTIVPDKFDSEGGDEPRLIIPLINKDKSLIGFQGRSFRKNSQLRYITIMLDDDSPKLFGLDDLDYTQPVIVVEGPIDSMFLPNCIASCGSDITTNLSTISSNTKQFTVVYDNEPRNIHTVAKMEKAIDRGFNVFVWPDTIEQKDVNDVILSGVTADKLVDIITENTYNGLQAKLKLNMWKRS